MCETRLTSAAALSLYTSIEAPGNYIGPTRSVLVQREITATEKRLLIYDNLTFSLFVAVPSVITSDRLDKFMTNSYHMATYYAFDAGNFTKSERPPRDLRLTSQSEETRLLIERVHTHGRSDYEAWQEQQNANRYQRTTTSEEGGQGSTPSSVAMVSAEFPIIKQMEVLSMNMGEGGETHYRLVFANHCILQYFLNKFHEKDVWLDQLPHRFRVLDFQYGQRINSLGARVALASFRGRHLSDYIDRQLLSFAPPTTSYALTFPSEGTTLLDRGLLSPCRVGAMVTSESTLQQLWQMRQKERGDHLPTSQILFVDLSQLRDVGDESDVDPEKTLPLRIYRVDYTERKTRLNNELLPKKKLQEVVKKVEEVAPVKQAKLARGQTTLTSMMAISKPPKEDSLLSRWSKKRDVPPGSDESEKKRQKV
jgi:hypothetical protein